MYSGIPVDDNRLQSKRTYSKIYFIILLIFFPNLVQTYVPPTLVVGVYSIVADKKIHDCRLSVRKNNTDQSYASFHCGKNSKDSSKVIG